LSAGPGRKRSLLLLYLGVLLSCRPSDSASRASEISVIDHAQRLVQLDSPAQRVVSLVPAVTDMIIEVGAAGRLIARTQFDNDPQLASLPSTNNALTPSLEWLTTLQPDLVISWLDQPSRSTVERLVTLGIPVYSARTGSIDDVVRTARDLGRLLGVPRQVDSTVTRLQAGLDSVRASVAGHPPTSILFLIAVQPPMAAGDSTFVGELIRLAGGKNVIADVGALWPQISVEEIIRRQPDVIVLSHEQRTDVLPALRTMPGWRELKAVREGRVVRVDPDVFSRPGPSMLMAARQLAEILHPGTFR
jgi:iron complex transport system substrate-binding protein